MEFGREMIKTPGLITRSGIRLVPENYLGDDPLDIMVCRSANEAAKDLFLGNEHPSKPPPRSSGKKPDDDGVANDAIDASKDNDNDDDKDNDTANNHADPAQQIQEDRNLELEALVNCSHYPDQDLPPPRPTIQPNDLVVVFESFNDLNFVYATPNAIFSNRNGHFHHNDFLGKPFGCKIRSRNNAGYGFLYLLRPTPELWMRSLPHRTQIVHELDASMIVHYLNLTPNMVVCESGTGSGAMSHVILRSIAPKGKLHTYEFNKVRVEKARREFVGHGLGHLVQVHWRDVCGKKKLLGMDGTNEENTIDYSRDATTSGDERTDDSDAANAKNNTEAQEEEEDDGNGGFQLPQATAHAIFLDLPEPWLAVPHAAYAIKPTGRICSYSPCMEQTQRTVAALRQHGFHSLRTVEARLKEYFVDEVEFDPVPTELPVIPTEETTASMEKERSEGQPSTLQQQTKQQPKDETESSGIRSKRKKIGSDSGNTNKVLCARPFPQMRGHTAFLTFATAGNAPRPDPNAS